MIYNLNISAELRKTHRHADRRSSILCLQAATNVTGLDDMDWQRLSVGDIADVKVYERKSQKDHANWESKYLFQGVRLRDGSNRSNSTRSTSSSSCPTVYEDPARAKEVEDALEELDEALSAGERAQQLLYITHM